MKIAVLGCGNMSSMIIKQIHKHDKSIKFFCYTPSKSKAKKLALEVKGQFIENIADFPSAIDYWLIGCKPQQYKELANNFIQKGQTIISIMAGIKICDLEQYFKTANIIRLMPNTSWEVGQAITLYTYSSSIKTNDTSYLIKLIEYGGVGVFVEDESQMGTLTLFTGSAPAFIYYFAQIIEEQLLVRCPTIENPRQIINALFKGSASLLEYRKDNIKDLKEQVMSKGGVTEAGIKSLEHLNFSDIISKSVDRAIQRECELGK